MNYCYRDYVYSNGLMSLYLEYRYLYSPIYIDIKYPLKIGALILSNAILLYAVPIKYYKHNHMTHIFK